jgi:hypothetical protein
MPLDFPSSPADGQIYNNYQWSVSSGAWKAIPSVTPVTIQSPTPPISPNKGDIWLNTTDGVFFTYYDDGTSKQWIEMMSSGIPTTPSYNYIINGAFDIWQRGTSSTVSNGVGAHTADRWLSVAGAGATVVTSQQAFTPGTAPVSGYEGTFFSRVNRTVTGSAGSFFLQRIEDVRSLAGQTVTVSFWAKAAANYSLGTGDLYFFQVFGAGGSAGVATGISSATTITTSWQRYSYTVTVPSVSGKTIGANSYLEMTFGLQTSTSTFTLDIWGVQVEAGSIATPFRRNAPSIQAELAACQRYYYQANAVFDNYFGMGGSWQANTFFYTHAVAVPLRAIPVSYGSSAASTFSILANSANSTPSAVALAGATTNAITFNFSITMAANSVGFLRESTVSTNTAFLFADAEL